MSELEHLLTVSENVAHAVCGIYWAFGFFSCMIIDFGVEYFYSKWKKRKKEEKVGDNI